MLDAADQAAILDAHEMEGLGRSDTREAGDRTRLLLEVGDHRRQRQVREAVAVVGKEYLLVLEIALHRLEAHADVRRQAGIDEGDLPVVDVASDQLDLPPPLREDEIVGDGLVVLEEVLLDGVGAVSEAEDELLVPEVRVVAHHVPEDRPVSDGHHGFGDVLGVLAQPHPETTAEQHDLHRSPLCSPAAAV